MTTKTMVSALIAATFASPAFAAPILNIIPQGQQAGNWVWEVDIAPDQSIVTGGTGTPLAIELGFRLSGDPLVNITNLTPAIFDTSTAGNVIFGWETQYTPVGGTSKPEGIEANCSSCTIFNATIIPFTGAHPATVVSGTTNEIFSAIGSANIVTSAPIPFLKIIAAGPGSGGPLSSTLQWLGAYGGKGRIAQIVGSTSQNFDIYSGSLTQSVPEPTGLALLAIAAAGCGAASKRQRLAR